MRERDGPICITSNRKSINNDQRQSAQKMTEAISNREQTELAEDWHKIVNIFDGYTDRRQEVTDMLAEFELM